jgi:uncharacterized membrane protein HdeD (DUF308 family)
MVTTSGVTKLEVPHIAWWLVLLEGLAAFIVGILILAAPGISTLALTQLLGAYWLVSGIFSIVSLFTSRRSWGWKLLSGVLGIVSGMIVFQNPMWSAILVPAVLGIFLAVDGILIGVMRLIMAARGAGLGIAILGVLSIALGVVILLYPPLAVITAIYAFALLSIVGGIGAFFIALSLRQLEELVPASSSVRTPAPIPVTGKRPEPEPESEHEGESTDEYTGDEEEKTP